MQEQKTSRLQKLREKWWARPLLTSLFFAGLSVLALFAVGIVGQVLGFTIGTVFLATFVIMIPGKYFKPVSWKSLGFLVLISGIGGGFVILTAPMASAATLPLLGIIFVAASLVTFLSIYRLELLIKTPAKRLHLTLSVLFIVLLIFIPLLMTGFLPTLLLMMIPASSGATSILAIIGGLIPNFEPIILYVLVAFVFATVFLVACGFMLLRRYNLTEDQVQLEKKALFQEIYNKCFQQLASESKNDLKSEIVLSDYGRNDETLDKLVQFLNLLANSEPEVQWKKEVLFAGFQKDLFINEVEQYFESFPDSDLTFLETYALRLIEICTNNNINVMKGDDSSPIIAVVAKQAYLAYARAVGFHLMMFSVQDAVTKGKEFNLEEKLLWGQSISKMKELNNAISKNVKNLDQPNHEEAFLSAAVVDSGLLNKMGNKGLFKKITLRVFGKGPKQLDQAFARMLLSNLPNYTYGNVIPTFTHLENKVEEDREFFTADIEREQLEIKYRLQFNEYEKDALKAVVIDAARKCKEEKIDFIQGKNILEDGIIAERAYWAYARKVGFTKEMFLKYIKGESFKKDEPFKLSTDEERENWKILKEMREVNQVVFPNVPFPLPSFMQTLYEYRSVAEKMPADNNKEESLGEGNQLLKWRGKADALSKLILLPQQQWVLGMEEYENSEADQFEESSVNPDLLLEKRTFREGKLQGEFQKNCSNFFNQCGKDYLKEDVIEAVQNCKDEKIDFMKGNNTNRTGIIAEQAYWAYANKIGFTKEMLEMYQKNILPNLNADKGLEMNEIMKGMKEINDLVFKDQTLDASLSFCVDATSTSSEFKMTSEI